MVDIGAEIWSVDYLLAAFFVVTIDVTVLTNPNPVVSFILAGVIVIAVYRRDRVRANYRRVGREVSSLLSRPSCVCFVTISAV